MIKTKSIHEEVDDFDGIRVIIMRHFPRNYPRENYDLYFGELAPTAENLRLYKGECEKDEVIKFDELLGRMVIDINENPKAQDQIRTLKKIHSLYMPVTLLCVEGPKDPCHRYKIADMIKEGIRQ